MPYGKMPYYKKKYNRRYNSRGDYQLAKKAYRLAKKAYKAPELKFHPFTGTITAPTSSGALEAVSSCAQGTTNNTRIGDLIRATSLYIRGKMSINASATATQVRFIIFQWIRETPSAVGDVLASASITSFKVDNASWQSRILYDRVFQLDSVNKPELYFQKKLKIKKNLAYGEGSSVASMNGLYALILSDEAVNTPTLDWNTRMYFTDP